MINDNNISVSELLTPEILAQMPKGLVGPDALHWKMNKVNELRSMRAAASQTNNTAEEQNNVTVDDTENIPTADDEEICETVSDENTASENEAEDEQTDEQPSEPIPQPEPVSVPKVRGRTAKQTPKSPSERKKASNGYEFIKNMPCEPMDALRRKFPQAASKVDLLSAVIYIFTDGDCEISENAMRLVESYKDENNQRSMFERTEERLGNIERMLREQRELLQSVELCTCWNTFDRRFGSKERAASPKETEFREKGNLDMLARLRTQAKDQRKIDDIEKGRAIYAQTKDKND